MANEEHLEILKKGVKQWNRWREEHPEVRPNLSRADLSRAHLEHGNLSGADLSLNVLCGAHLSGADLSGADLRGTDLGQTDLSGAHLEHADLSDAGTDLSGANLRSADLRNANFRDAQLWGTVFADVDLRQVKGLGAVNHVGPSTIGTNTLERSRGQIPAAFLRGCGLSDWQIENAKLFNPELDEDQMTMVLYEVTRIRGQQPWALSRVFISYTREDEAFVKAIERRFDEKGVRYWRDVHHLKAGRVERQIDRAITLYPLVLLVLSERSVQSDWVEWEAAKARELERQHLAAGEPRDVLCPVSLDEAWKSCSWPGPLRRQIEDYHVLDFSGWEDDEEKMGRQFTKLYEGMVLNHGRKSS